MRKQGKTVVHSVPAVCSMPYELLKSLSDLYDSLFARAVKKVGAQKAWQIFSEAKQESRIPHRFFIWKCLSKKANTFPQAS